jgi:hypothetical protein
MGMLFLRNPIPAKYETRYSTSNIFAGLQYVKCDPGLSQDDSLPATHHLQQSPISPAKARNRYPPLEFVPECSQKIRLGCRCQFPNLGIDICPVCVTILPVYNRGSTIPCCFWYLPLRSA